MKRGWGGWGALLLILVVAAASLGVPAAADTADEIARRIAELERELEEVQAGIEDVELSVDANLEVLAATEQDLAVARRRLTTVEVDLEAARVRLALASQDVTAGERRIAGVESRMALLEAQLAEIRTEILAATLSLERRAVDLYVGFFSAGRWAVLQQDNLVDLTLGRAYGGDLLAEADQEIRDLHALDQDRVEKEVLLERERALASEELVLLEEHREQQSAELWEVERLRIEGQSSVTAVEDLLDGVQLQIQAYLQEKEGLLDDAERLGREIAYRKVLLTRALRPGRLAWPADGLITSGFGWRTHPILNRRIFHNGIDLDSPHGTPVRAAGDGRVILAQSWSGFGNTVVIQHGGDVTTIYGHLSRFGASVGNDVREGNVIGYVGCTGLCTGPHLHFEVREDGTPVNPLKYLQG
ncbi:MAG: peptidoglycan DD-metalloendopeptidase family protein [bacterium]|nr:peptidoglycan DD-metalloendopeptidase family protein [bacterium]MDE0600579.1 peptidoglycan DD-metalloendopeptidase family protein [bacterium]